MAPNQQMQPYSESRMNKNLEKFLNLQNANRRDLQVLRTNAPNAGGGSSGGGQRPHHNHNNLNRRVRLGTVVRGNSTTFACMF